MPIYEYACDDCGKHHEIMQKITDKPLSHCPACGGKMRKLISSTSFVLKGTGWYKTDYATDRKKGEKKHIGEAKSEDSKAGEKPKEVTHEAKKAETKAEPKTEKKEKKEKKEAKTSKA